MLICSVLLLSLFHAQGRGVCDITSKYTQYKLSLLQVQVSLAEESRTSSWPSLFSAPGFFSVDASEVSLTVRDESVLYTLYTLSGLGLIGHPTVDL